MEDRLTPKEGTEYFRGAFIVDGVYPVYRDTVVGPGGICQRERIANFYDEQEADRFVEAMNKREKKRKTKSYRVLKVVLEEE